MKTLNDCGMIMRFNRPERVRTKWANINNRKMRRFKRGLKIDSPELFNPLYEPFPKNEYKLPMIKGEYSLSDEQAEALKQFFKNVPIIPC